MHGGVLLPRLQPFRILRARSGALLLARAIGFQATAVERHTVGLQAFRSAPSPTSSTPTPLPSQPASTAKTHPGRRRGRLVALKGRPSLGRPLLRALATAGGCCHICARTVRVNRETSHICAGTARRRRRLVAAIVAASSGPVPCRKARIADSAAPLRCAVQRFVCAATPSAALIGRVDPVPSFHQGRSRRRPRPAETRRK